MFDFDKEKDWVDLEGGISRKIMSYSEHMMVVKARFEKGSIGMIHQHVHTQSTSVLSGKFEFTIGAEKRVISAGDTCLMPSNILHGCVCLEKGELLDVFTPMRKDFL